jgi:molybdopterin/thiamine biosynthesis adenylyltransferase
MLIPWWERFPQVLAEEEADLERLGGRPPVLNELLLERAKIRQYDVHYAHDGGCYALTVTYSDVHPYFRVEVTARDRFRTHQHPYRGHLCLIRGGTWNWDVNETAAQLIESQMPALLADHFAAGDAPPATGAATHNQASTVAQLAREHVEPFVGYYSYAPRTAIRVDGGWEDLTEADSGTVLVGLDEPHDLKALRGAVLEVRDAVGKVIRQAHPRITAGFPRRVTGRWCRLAVRPEQDDPQAIRAAVEEAGPPFVDRVQTLVGDFQLELTAVVFTDGVKPHIHGDAWIFVVEAKGPRPPPPPPPRKGNRRGTATPAKRIRVDPYLARAYRAGPQDLAERVPHLAPLRAMKVVIFGAGGVGAPSAVEFAKAGIGTLTIVESDIIEPGNAPRWIAGYGAAGLHKLDGLSQLIRWNWPYTNLELLGWRLGAVRDSPDQPPDWEVLDKVLADADLIYDATAEVGVNYFLSEVAKERGLPLVVVSATEGGWGGRVVRFRSGDGEACWTCLMHHEQDDAQLIPPADPDPATSQVWPAGCTDPTFTGTGFDIAAIAGAGVRMATSALCEGAEGGYPSATWDLAVYAFRDATNALPGNAKTLVLRPHPDCKPCRIRLSG